MRCQAKVEENRGHLLWDGSAEQRRAGRSSRRVVKRMLRALPGHWVRCDDRPLDFNRAVDCVDHAAELDNCAVASALNHAAMMRVDRRIDQIAAQPPEARQRAILVRSRKTAITDDIRDQDRRDLPGSRHAE